MYISGPNRISALDATSGRELWTFRQPLTDGVIGDAGRDANRGVAVRGDHVFMITDHAHAIAVNRWTGQKVWDTEMADYRENYSATVAPLVVGDLVIAGVSGGDEGVRGFLDAYHADTGERAWRFWTIPSREDPEAATWIGPGLEHGCGATWLSGSYDAELDLIYWPIGNPCPDMDGEGRLGDNLYTDSIVALRPKTGEMVWYYQTTPHDTHDWDAIAPLILVDEQWEGRPRKLLVQANRNGFYYVFDRTNGELLMAKPHIDELTWATGIGKDGRPITTPGWESTLEGSRVCPGLSGGANWLSASYDPQTKLMIFQDLESCAVYVRSPTDWRAGVRFFGGSSRTEPGSQKLVRAINILTGERVWQLPMAGPPRNSAGTLATAGGVVITGDNGGALMALDSKSGELLWRADFNQTLTASPMTYMVSGKQYVSIPTAFGYLAFALPD
jgi:alcohol dehydrogenase (cytochrome c)